MLLFLLDYFEAMADWLNLSIISDVGRLSSSEAMIMVAEDRAKDGRVADSSVCASIDRDSHVITAIAPTINPEMAPRIVILRQCNDNRITGANVAANPDHAYETKLITELLGFHAMTNAKSVINIIDIRLSSIFS